MVFTTGFMATMDINSQVIGTAAIYFIFLKQLQTFDSESTSQGGWLFQTAVRSNDTQLYRK